MAFGQQSRCSNLPRSRRPPALRGCSNSQRMHRPQPLSVLAKAQRSLSSRDTSVLSRESFQRAGGPTSADSTFSQLKEDDVTAVSKDSPKLQEVPLFIDASELSRKSFVAAGFEILTQPLVTIGASFKRTSGHAIIVQSSRYPTSDHRNPCPSNC